MPQPPAQVIGAEHFVAMIICRAYEARGPLANAAASDARVHPTRGSRSRAGPDTIRGAVVGSSTERPVGLDTARRNHERPIRRHAGVAERGDRHEAEETDVIGLAGKNRRVILTAAVRADAGRSRESRKVQPVLDTPQVPRNVVHAPQMTSPFGTLAKAGALDQGKRDADRQRARAAHAGGARQVAGNRDVGAEIASRKIHMKAMRDHVHVALNAR